MFLFVGEGGGKTTIKKWVFRGKKRVIGL